MDRGVFMQALLLATATTLHHSNQLFIGKLFFGQIIIIRTNIKFSNRTYESRSKLSIVNWVRTDHKIYGYNLRQNSNFES